MGQVEEGNAKDWNYYVGSPNQVEKVEPSKEEECKIMKSMRTLRFPLSKAVKGNVGAASL
jgi:hypothetical protein